MIAKRYVTYIMALEPLQHAGDSITIPIWGPLPHWYTAARWAGFVGGDGIGTGISIKTDRKAGTQTITTKVDRRGKLDYCQHCGMVAFLAYWRYCARQGCGARLPWPSND